MTRMPNIGFLFVRTMVCIIGFIYSELMGTPSPECYFTNVYVLAMPHMQTNI